MFIYIVKPGDSIYSISRKFQVPIDTVRSVNGLIMDDLVPGQAIIISSATYIVQPGDSLSFISRISYIPIPMLLDANGLKLDSGLYVGMKLKLPQRAKYLEEGLSYLLPSTPEKIHQTIKNFANLNTYYGIFEYHITEDGNLSELPLDEITISVSYVHHVAPLAVITNLTPGGFSSEKTKRLLQIPENRSRLISNILSLMKSKKFSGVNIDFEQVTANERDLYSGFISELSERLRAEGYYTSVALPVKRNDFENPGYDYGGLASAVDFVFIMAYDFHESHSSPGPVAPINEIRKTLDYATKYISRNKIILGVPRYGFDWAQSYNGKMLSAKAVSVTTATNTAIQYEASIFYSDQFQQPYFHYWDEQGLYHSVWFEDARARAAKCQLVVDYQLRGIGAWQLGLNFPQSAYLILHFFTQIRVV